MCPHTATDVSSYCLLHASSYCCIFVSSYCCICVLIMLCMRRHTAISACSLCYICVLIRLHTHTYVGCSRIRRSAPLTMYLASSLCYMCHHTTTHTHTHMGCSRVRRSAPFTAYLACSYCYICVLIRLHTNMCVCVYYVSSVLILLYVSSYDYTHTPMGCSRVRRSAPFTVYLASSYCYICVLILLYIL